MSLPKASDVIAEFQKPMFELLVNFADAILDSLSAKTVDDVRRDMVDPLREKLLVDASQERLEAELEAELLATTTTESQPVETALQPAETLDTTVNTTLNKTPNKRGLERTASELTIQSPIKRRK